ncbi:hypothetical protein BWD09_07190 [Neisseria dentiae]|uniref:Uncharacterized protein n=2 Tax=Neisseria dentiae TaxID=194197 RepID=A0A1X3D9C2_9NEIS|nr:hypothetical protein BWD09_07190 [Neisseria dentiae]
MSVQMFLHNRQGGIAVVTDQCGKKAQFLNDTLRPIPHPDTIRLDWVEICEINDQCPLIEWDDYLGEWEVKYPDSKFSFEYLRDAIDFAISEEQADD